MPHNEERTERKGRSEPSIRAVQNSILRDLLGLSEEASSHVKRVIRSQGEWADMKRHLRRLSGTTWARLNMVLDMASLDVDSERMPDEITDEMPPEDMADEMPPEDMTDEMPPAERRMPEGKTETKPLSELFVMFRSPDVLPAIGGFNPKPLQQWSQSESKKKKRKRNKDLDVGSKKLGYKRVKLVREKLQSPDNLPGQKGHDPKKMQDWSKQASKAGSKKKQPDSAVGSKKQMLKGKTWDLTKVSFKGYLLNEANVRAMAQQMVSAQGTDKAERVGRARMNPNALRKEYEKELADLAGSDDTTDKQIFAIKKRLAMLQQKKAAEAEKANGAT